MNSHKTNEAKIQDLKNKIAFWTSRQSRVKNPVEKAVLSDKIKEAREEIIKIQNQKQVSITNPVGTPIVADKDLNKGSSIREGSGFGRIFL